MILQTFDHAKLKLLFSDGRTFVCTEDTHYKVWSVAQKGNEAVVSWGRIGNRVQSQTKKFSSDWGAKRFINEKIEEKTKKGYKEI
jgi:predicted DNA-binding WGR domain protein